MTKQELLDKANDLPLAPGVYLMMDKTGCVIYVGKAKKLKNRVSQYFQENSSHNEKTRRMVSQVDHFDTIFVSTEFEALILENSLIKQHMPRYNILLKDDKGYPFVRLGTEHYPRFTMASKPADDNALYFGPFGGRNETRAAIDAICAAFRLPTCSRKFPRDIGKERPCLNHHMGRCDAFCRGTPDEDEYMRRIGQAEELLNGHYRRLTRALREEMEQEAADLHFEQAAALRDRIRARLTVAGQLEGGIAQGVGYALYERMEINPRSRRTLSTDFLHYRIPQMGDMPRTYVDMVSSHDPYGPHGAKSVGELATVPVAPAIVNAVRRASGIEINSLPLCDKFAILPTERGNVK